MKSDRCPWIRQDALKLIYERDTLHNVALKTQDREVWTKYKIARNRATSYFRASKKQYFHNKIYENSHNSKGMWKCLRQLLPSKNKSNDLPNDVSPDDFNIFFTSIGCNLTSHFNKKVLPKVNIGRPDVSFAFVDVMDDFVLKRLLSLPDTHGMDILNLDNTLLRTAAPLISSSLTSLFNFSLSTSHIPKDWKRALVTPIYKGNGNKADPSNYRPISITPIISKIFESSVKQQLVDYIGLFISDKQSAYLSGRSTQTALHTIIDVMGKNLDEGSVTALCALDLAKGFDTIDHKILLHKLMFYGFSNTCVQWFSSYLSERSQQVKIGLHTSCELPVTIGVPQGSILGPLLFIIYVNDFPSIFTDCHCVMYADDTTLECCASTVDEVQIKLQNSINLAHRWFVDNRLIVNTKKSSVMLVGSPNSINGCTLSINFDAKLLPQVCEQLILGVYIDSYLNWKFHITTMEKSLASKIGMLHRISRFLPSSSLISIYVAIIQSKFDYGITHWGCSCKTYLKTLQKMQNRCARIVSKNFDFNISSKTLLKQLGWMDIYTRFQYFIGILMYKFVHNLLPPSVSSMFTLVRNSHSYPTRSSVTNDIALPLPRSEMYKKMLPFNGPKVWNSVPHQMRNSSSLDQFKKSYKKYLLNLFS